MPLLGSSSGSSENAFRGNLDDFPVQFTLASLTDLEPGVVGVATTTITGINYQAIVTATNNALVSIDGGPYSTATLSSPRYIKNNQTLSVKFDTTVGSVDDFSKVYSTVVKIGRVTANWSVSTRAYDDTPNDFIFINAINLPLGIVTNSNIATISGLEPNFATLSYITAGVGSFSINGADPVYEGSVANGDTVYIQQRTANTYATSNSTTLRIGSKSATYSAATRAADISINGFSLTNLTNVPISLNQDSNTVTISGADSGVPLSVVLSAPGQVKVNNGSYITGFTNCLNGDTLTIRIPASALTNYSQTTTTNINVSGFTTTFSVTTRPSPIKTIPDQFIFTDVTGAVPFSTVTSNNITLTGITTGSSGTATISGSNGEFQVTRNGSIIKGFSTTSTSVTNGDVISLRLTAAGENQNRQTTFTVSGTDTTVNISGTAGQISDIWSVTSGLLACALPQPLLTNTFTDVSNVEVNTVQTKTFTVSGLNTGCDNVLTTSSPNSTITKNGINVGASTPIQNGDVIVVSLTSAPTYSTERTTVITSKRLSGADSISTTWRVTTTIEDTLPNVFNISTQNVTQAEPNTVYTIEVGTVSGLTAATLVNATVTSTNGTARISKNSTAPGSFLTSLSGVKNGDIIRMSMTANPSYGNFTETATLTIGQLTEQWTITNATVPFPTVQLSISPNPISLNGSTNLTWSSTNATSVVSSNFNATSVNGSLTVNNITQQTVYTITVSNSRGDATASATVFVNVPPPPTVTLSLGKVSVVEGEITTLTWNSNNATSVVSSSGFSANSVSGSTVVGPYNLSPGANSAIITYFLTVANSTGQQATASISLTVNKQIPTLTMNPSGTLSIPYNGSFSLNWSATNASTMSASFPIGATEFSGSRTFNNIIQNTSYFVQAAGASGTIAKTLDVIVSSPLPTATLTASATSVPYNGSVTLTWTVSNTTSYTTNFGQSGTTNGGSVTLNLLKQSKTYTLTATNATGSTTVDVTVNVGACTVSVLDDDASFVQAKTKGGVITFTNGSTTSGSYFVSSLLPNQPFTSSTYTTVPNPNSYVIRRAFTFGILHKRIYNKFIATLGIPPTSTQVAYYIDLFLKANNNYKLLDELDTFIDTNNQITLQQNNANGGVGTFNDICLQPWFTTNPVPSTQSCSFNGQNFFGSVIIPDTTKNYRYFPGFVIFGNKTDNAVNDFAVPSNYYVETITDNILLPNRPSFTYAQVHDTIVTTYIQELGILPPTTALDSYVSSFNSSSSPYTSLTSLANAIKTNLSSQKATWLTYGGAYGQVDSCGNTIFIS
jgi:hypothetical protein